MVVEAAVIEVEPVDIDVGPIRQGGRYHQNACRPEVASASRLAFPPRAAEHSLPASPEKFNTFSKFNNFNTFTVATPALDHPTLIHPRAPRLGATSPSPVSDGRGG